MNDAGRATSILRAGGLLEGQKEKDDGKEITGRVEKEINGRNGIDCRRSKTSTRNEIADGTTLFHGKKAKNYFLIKSQPATKHSRFQINKAENEQFKTGRLK